MKERVTIRLCEQARACGCRASQTYLPAEDVSGWDYQPGEQIGLQERNGGYLMGVIEQVQPRIYHDQTGRYKLAILWTQD